ncbi:MAG TPA: MFS transporter [Syntrophomonas sp.]|nr:MFS transporter [Syntrophomonas sp.]
MYNTPTKRYGALVYASIFSIMVLQFTLAIVTPGLGAIAEGLPGVRVELIQMIQSIQGLVMVPAALLVSVLDRHIAKRQILYIAIACILIGGTAPGFGGGIYFILLCRVIYGFGYGLVFPLAFAVIDGLFEGKQRDDMVGYENAIGSFSGILLQFLGGILAAISWRAIFLGYFIAIPFALLIIWKLPEPPQKETGAGKGSKQTGYTAGLTRNTLALTSLNIVNWIMIFTFMTTISIVFTVEAIAPARNAAYILMLFTFCAFLTGLVYGKVRLAIGNYTLALSLGLLGCGLTICLLSASIAMFCLAAVIFGFGFGFYTPEINVLIMNSAAPEASTASNSLFVASTGIGQFLSPMILSVIITCFHLSGARSGWLVAGTSLIIIGILAVVSAKAGGRTYKDSHVIT